MNGKKNKKPFSDPRWREWPKTGIKWSGKANEELKKSAQKILKDLKDKRKQDNGKR